MKTENELELERLNAEIAAAKALDSYYMSWKCPKREQAKPCTPEFVHFEYLPSFQLVRLAVCPEHGPMTPIENSRIRASGHPSERVRIAHIELPVNV